MRISGPVAAFGLVLFTGSYFAGAVAAVPNSVLYWNNLTLEALSGSNPGLATVSEARVLACVHHSILHALREARRHSDADPVLEQSAISHAAHNVLSTIFNPSQRTFDAALEIFFANLTQDATDAAVVKGREIGREAALNTLGLSIRNKENDFVPYSNPYTPENPFGAPGQYVPTPPLFVLPPETPQQRYVTPIILPKSIDSYRVPPPPKPSDQSYVPFVDEVKALGSKTSVTRSPYDTQTAYFWLESNTFRFNRILTTIIGGLQSPPDYFTAAHLYAVLNFALFDTGIAVWDNKYEYDAWRPFTAIRFPGVYLYGGKDVHDSNWTSLIVAPPHQDYVSGHAALGKAAATVLKHYLKADTIPKISITYNVTVDNIGLITREYTSLDAISTENGRSRVFGGVHFRFADEQGQALGEKVAGDVIAAFDENWGPIDLPAVKRRARRNLA